MIVNMPRLYVQGFEIVDEDDVVAELVVSDAPTPGEIERTEQIGRLLAAAPDMADILLMLGSSYVELTDLPEGCFECRWCRATAPPEALMVHLQGCALADVLAKAGVL